MRFQPATFALGQAVQPDGPNRDTLEFQDLVAQLGKHATNFAVFSLGQDHLDPLALPLGFEELHMVGSGLAIAQPDPIGQARQVFGGGMAGDKHLVGFFDPVTGMGQFESQFAVVGQKQKAFAFLVQAPDRVNPLGHMIDEVEGTGPARGIVIGANVPLGFVD